MTTGRRRTLIGAYATFALFTVLAGQFWRNLLGWWGFAAVAVVVIGGAVALLVAERPEWRWRRVPKSTIAFLVIATLSLAWSYYPAATLLGLAITLSTTLVAVVARALRLVDAHRARARRSHQVDPRPLDPVRAVGRDLRAGAGAPNFTDYGDDSADGVLLVAASALPGRAHRGHRREPQPARHGRAARADRLRLAARGRQRPACAGHRLARRRRHRPAPHAIGDRDPRRRDRARRRSGSSSGRGRSGPIVAAACTGRRPARSWHPWPCSLVFWNSLLTLLGKSEDLTGRLDIWNAVIGLALERPWFGWGWVGYWQPWVEPFDGLAVRNGVELSPGAQRLARRLDAARHRRARRLRLDRRQRAVALVVPGRRPAEGRCGPPAPPLRCRAGAPPAAGRPHRPEPRREPHPRSRAGGLLLIAIAWSTKQRQWAAEPLPAEPSPTPASRMRPPGVTR